MRTLPTGTVTFLFTDMAGSTRLLQLLGKRYAAVLAECRELMRVAFQQHHGHEVDTQGDAFFVAFARATDAVSAAITAQRALAGHSWPEGVPVRVRMGLHTGEPDLASEGYVGLSVHHAARIMSAGHGGQVLLSQVTCDLVEHDLPEHVSLCDLGEHRLKDLRHPHHLFQLVIAGLAADFPPLKTLESYPNNLPIQPTPFIGREKEVAAVQQHLLRDGVRLLTLTGPGGVGKTRLSLHVAAELTDRFADGTWFVSLAPLSDPALVMPTIAQTLGLQEEKDRSLLDQLRVNLHGKQVLLLLDNFEHVASAATHVADLLAVCPRLKVLVTSREALHVRAEREFPVPALTLPDLKHLPDLAALSQYEAVALFIERAQAVKPAFQVTNANAPAVAEICARLDGLPLAIELAAARIKLFPPQELLTRLGQRLQLLTSSLRDVPARQQTLRKTIQWSYDLLTAPEQQLFRRLSVFVGGCTFQAIEAVSATLGDETTLVLDDVGSLIDKNLLQQTAQEGEELRLTMLETIREFGLEALGRSGEMEATRQAHAAYYLQLAEATAPELDGPQQDVWFHRLERDHDNLRAALNYLLERGEARERIEMALRLGVALEYFWWIRSLASEGWIFLERALAMSEGVAVSVRAKACGTAGNMAGWLGNVDRGEALCQESLALFRESGDVAEIGNALRSLGSSRYLRGDLATARTYFEEGLEVYKEAGDKSGIAWSLFGLSLMDTLQGEYVGGHSRAEAGLLLFRGLGDKKGIALSLGLIAEWYLNEGDAAKAHPLLEESRALYKEIGNKEYEKLALCGLGRVAFMQGNRALARSLLEEGSTNLPREETPGELDNKAWVLCHLAQVVAFEGDYATARALYEQCLAIVKKVDFKVWTPFYLEGLAGVVAAQGELSWAVRLWGAAEALRDALGTPIPPAYRVDYERSVAAARTHLSEQSFAAAWAEGRSMTLDQVLVAPE